MHNLTKDAALPASTKLPLELTDKIIDCLLADDAALRACSLVCRAFLRRSRYHRFRYVNLNQRTSEKFENLLNTSPDIGAYVRELHVSTSTFERPPTWVDERLPRIASRLSAVASLHLKGNGEYRAAPFYHLSSVRELHMTHCEVYTMNEFASIIGSFQDLEVVCCRDVLVGRSQTLDANPAKLKRAPRVLEFSSCRLDGPMLVDWLLINGLHNPLSITLVPLQRAAIEAVGRFMRIAAPTLRSLKLAMVVIKSDTTFSEYLRECFGVSTMTNLEFLEFGSPALYALQYGADDLSFEWIFQLLDDITSPIEQLAFSLWSGDREAVVGEDWVRISNLLQLPRFSTLKKITFHVWGQPTPCQVIMDTVKRLLSDFDESGILHFDTVPDPEY